MTSLKRSIIAADCNVFPNAACVATLADPPLHRGEVIEIQGDSYRHKEAVERAENCGGSRPVLVSFQQRDGIVDMLIDATAEELEAWLRGLAG